MNITLHKAMPEDVENVFRIIKERIIWMDFVGLKHWNTKGYLDVFPIEYYREQQIRGTLYVARDTSMVKITGVVVLLDVDASWPDRLDTDAIYIHNFATDVQMTGVGRMMLTEIEKIAKEKGKRYLRLDCDEENAFLNDYYQEKGFILQEGKSRLGSYTGNRLEKDLWKSNGFDK